MGKEPWTGLEENWLSLVLGQSATTSWEEVSMNMGGFALLSHFCDASTASLTRALGVLTTV